MAVTVSCPGCDAPFPIAEELLGKKIRCKKCQETFVAAAAKATVGAVTKSGGPVGTARLVSKNGAQLAERKAPAAPATAGNRKGLLAAAIGGGALFAVMAGITIYLLSSGTSTPEPKPAGVPVVKLDAPKLDVNDPAPAAVKPTEKAKPAEVTKSNEPAAKAKPEAKPAWFVTSPRSLPPMATPETQARVKKSAVLFKVTGDHGGGYGSGWMAEPGIIITNSHVVGMKDPLSPPPREVECVLDSGLPTERKFKGEILGLDRENDLAVVRIEGENLPAPMPIARTSDLYEGTKLYTAGFPLGTMVEKGFAEGKDVLRTQVKFRESSVTGRLPNKVNSVKLIQMEGGVDGGNSGGMVVDSTGLVRGIVVMQHPRTNMRFAIPSEYAVYLLRGRVLRVVPGQPYTSGNKIRQPLTAYVADPMKRIKDVTLSLWTGESGKHGVRPESAQAPKPEVGDGPVVQVPMPYDGNRPIELGAAHAISTEFDLPPLKDGQVYWLQPRYTGHDGKDRWGEAVALTTAGLPVERKPARLVNNHKPDTSRVVDLDSNVGFGVTLKDGEMMIRNTGVNVKLDEKVGAVDKDGNAKVTIKYSDLKFLDPDYDRMFRSFARGALEVALNMSTELLVTKRGTFKTAKPVLDKVPVVARPMIRDFNLQTVQSLEALALALPDKELQPGDTWEHDQNYSIRASVPLIEADPQSPAGYTVTFRPMTENALFRLKYHYVGRRERGGRHEAVVEYSGQIVKGEGNDVTAELNSGADAKEKVDRKDRDVRIRGLAGTARGAALVDLETGLVSLARTKADMEFEVPSVVFGTLWFGGEFRLELFRHVHSGAKKPDADRLLPNSEVVLDPFVGQPDMSLSSVGTGGTAVARRR